MDEQTKAELLREFRLAAEDMVKEWARRIHDSDENPMHAVYHDDGTVVLTRELPIGIDQEIRLRFAVGVVEYQEKPSGFIVRSTWGEVNIGDWVRAPKSADMYRVTDKVHSYPGRVVIEIEVDGKPFRKERNEDESVHVRRQSVETSTQDDAEAAAIALLAEAFPGSEILS